MLYAYHEQLHAIGKNMARWNDAATQVMAHFDQQWVRFSPLPFSSNSFSSNPQWLAGSELFNRLVCDYQKPAFGLTKTANDTLNLHEKIILNKPFCHLLQFVRSNKKSEVVLGKAKILLVAPMSGHYATLLRDTVRALIDTYDVFITDWKNAREVPLAEGDFGFDDYVEYVIEFIQLLNRDSAKERSDSRVHQSLHVIAVCQPTVPVLAAISLMSADPLRPQSMTLMGGPIDVRAAPTAVTHLAAKHPLQWFKDHMTHTVPANYLGVGRAVYPGFLQHLAFVSMNPSRHFSAHMDFFKHLVQGDEDSALSHRRFYDEYNAVADLPANFYLETIERVFQQAALAAGTLTVAGQLVRPSTITDVALLTVEGGRDDISAPGQTAAAHALCDHLPAEKQHKLFIPTAGHYGVFSGRLWRSTVAPAIKEFMATHTT